MKKILFLHGLESSQGGEKIDFLSSKALVHAPSINYLDPEVFHKIKSIIQDFKPDLIIGSSMGGYFAYIMGGIFNIQVMLFNPALHSRNFEPKVPSLIKHPNKMIVVLGINDDVIPPMKTVDYLRPLGCKPTITLQNMTHRTDINVFINMYNKYIL